MSRGITLLIGRLPTISGELAGLAASARRVISMMATRVCLLPPPLCPADGARVHVITQISPSALSLLTTLSGSTRTHRPVASSKFWGGHTSQIVDLFKATNENETIKILTVFE